MHRSLMVLWLVLAVSGCATNFATDSRYRIEGPGTELYSVETPVATDNLRKYIWELAGQADLRSPGNPGAGNEFFQASAGEWNILVRTGMNDIDLRCDNYLTWIDQKRAERIMVNDTITAISALAAGILGLAAPETSAISYIALGLGFAGTVYNSYQNSILMGLESSTIKTIVHERRLSLRAAWSDWDFTDKAAAVYALRSYLRICTPQAITLDVNTYSRDGITGKYTSRLKDEIVREKKGIGKKIEPKDAAGQALDRGLVVSPLRYDKLFFGWKPQKVELDDLLRGLCYSEKSSGPVFGSDGLPGPRMVTSIAIAEAELYSDKPDHRGRDGKINSSEFTRITQRREDCASINVQNYHEAMQYDRPERVIGLIEQINDISPVCIATTGESLVVGGTLRARIRQLRTELANMLRSDERLIGVEEQLTVALTRAINELSEASKTRCTNP